MKYPVKEIRISHSTMMQYRSCPRKTEFSKLFLHRDSKESLASEVGKALHEAFQTYMATDDWDAAVWSLMKHYPYHLNDNPMNDRSLETCYGVLEAMVEHNKLGEYEMVYFEHKGERVPAIEVRFEIHLKGLIEGIPVRYVGLIDLILYDVVNDRYIVVDIKTTRQNLSDYTPMYEFSEQCLPYALVLEQLLGHEVRSMEVIYLNAYIHIIEPRVGFYQFTKDEDDVQDWVRGLKVDMTNFAMYMEMQWFPRHSGACMSFNRPCYYNELCRHRDPDLIQDLILMNHEPADAEDTEEYLVSMELEVA